MGNIDDNLLNIDSFLLSIDSGLINLDGNSVIGISSASVAANGTTWTIRFNKAASQGASWSVLDFDATASTTGAITFSYVSGDGTNNWVLTGSATVVTGETVTLDWAGTVDGIEDADGVDLAAVSGKSVTNNVPSAGGTDNLLLETGDNLLLETGDLLLLETA